MPIPELQLETWARQGAIAGSAAAYNSIKTALTCEASKVRTLSPDIFLQGSYRNATNIYADSDVDVVVKLDSIFARDVTALDTNQRTRQQNAHTFSTYQWENFRTDVMETLVDYYRRPSVTPGDKCIKVASGPGRLTADVVPAIDFFKYDYFYSLETQSHAKGIMFRDSSGRQIVNFPKQHIANGETKNAAGRTDGWYKGTVRAFKNARNKLIDDGKLAAGSAPSYCVECLIYNAPDPCFGGNYGDTYCAVVNHLWRKSFVTFTSQNEIIPLFGRSAAQWNTDAATEFLVGLRTLWNDWK